MPCRDVRRKCGLFAYGGLIMTGFSVLKVFSTILLLVLFLPGIGAEQREIEQTGDIPRYRVGVEMVSLPVVVTTDKGKRIKNLNKDDFVIYEDNVEQEIAAFAATDEPLAIALLLDTSGSTQKRLAEIQNAAIDFVNQLHPDDEVAVVSFAEEVRLKSDFSINRDRNERGIKMTRTGERTVLYEAVWLALEQVLKPVTERKALVLFTDGVDTGSMDSDKRETLKLSEETKATIYCVYYDTERELSTTGSLNKQTFPQIVINPQPQIIRRAGGVGSTSQDYMMGRAYLNELAENSGGLVLDGSEDLRGSFAEIARELASQYSIGYYPTDAPRERKFRKVKIKMKNPDLHARTRKGYHSNVR